MCSVPRGYPNTSYYCSPHLSPSSLSILPCLSLLPSRLPHRHSRRLRRVRPNALDNRPRRSNTCFRLTTPCLCPLAQPATGSICVRLLRHCARMYLHCFGQGFQCVCGHVCDSHNAVLFDCNLAALTYREEKCAPWTGKSSDTRPLNQKASTE